MKVLVFLGSVRESTPPKPKRLGQRVALACLDQLHSEGVDASLIDPLDFDLAPPFKPYFAHRASDAPDDLRSLAESISSADGYVMVSPEYNHSMSPALADLLNHFGSSRFSFKPSAIVTYSAGQWGGVRAAVGMRTYLSELGCLPVSAMVHIPHAHTVFDKDGGFAEGVDQKRWRTYLGRAFEQLVWWSEAAAAQREASETTPAFRKDPSQRNAPE